MEEKELEIYRDAKMRQIIRESSQEIRDLERMLKCAYIGKERRVQMSEREAHHLKEKVCF
jgi:hypothetical protein